MNHERAKTLVSLAINHYKLNLEGLTILTEAATGHFVWTSIICAVAGAEKVYAFTEDSEFGSVLEVKELTRNLARECGVEGRVDVTAVRKEQAFSEADIVTNLGFVRPINEAHIQVMKKDAVITLMCEPWECREADTDIRACRRHNIAVMGTDENARGLETFGYLGHLIVKLAMEMDIEIKGSQIGIIGSGYKGHTGKELLASMGAEIVTKLSPFTDLLVVIEPNSYHELIKAQQILNINPGMAVVHIVGNIDKGEMIDVGIKVNPKREVPPGCMPVTLGYLGPKPLIDLHTAGLKVGEALVRGLRLKGNFMEAQWYAGKRAPALDINTVLKGRL